MKTASLLVTSFVALTTAAVSLIGFPILFADRITASVTIADRSLLGQQITTLIPILEDVGRTLEKQTVTVALRGQTHTAPLSTIGLQLDIPATIQELQRNPARWPWQRTVLTPQFRVDTPSVVTYLETAFQNTIQPPQNASLTITAAGGIQARPARPGEVVDAPLLTAAVREALAQAHPAPIPLAVITSSPRVEDHETEVARGAAQDLLTRGMALTFEDQTFVLGGGTLRNLIEFVEQVDPQDPSNYILGVRLHPDRLRQYLERDIAAQLNQPAVDARLTIGQADGEAQPKVTEFSAPRRGLALNLDATAQHIARAVSLGHPQVPLVVDVTQPAITENTDIQALGVTTLLARGESDFAGSPRNRVHNITVGATRYHGLLVPPEAEFSFNEYLGPVNAAAGFKPELVIKNHTTTPEYGGGLCQVSTTAFRAAVYSGLEVTERRNHAYAVRYYGTPGFDATIYPGYTDLRFRNDTPAHILIQTKIEGTKLFFEFWGTPDGRTVEVDGPHPYNRQPNGAVKATLTQRVLKDNNVVRETVFASNYKSPDLYPKVLAANGSPPPQSTPNPVSPRTSTPTPTPSVGRTP